MTIKPKTIKEAIDNLQQFLECDLYTKLKPEIDIKGMDFIREDYIANEEEFLVYMNSHFNILRKEINSIELKSLKKKRQKLIKSQRTIEKGKEILKRLRSRNC